MMEYKTCVAIITHKEILTGDEDKSVRRQVELFSKNKKVFIVIPDNINTNYYSQFVNENTSLLRIDNKALSSYDEYNHTLCKKWFYELFIDYDYVLISQTDVWIFYDGLDYFTSLGYDYYGAPWPFLNHKVGNGGLSLRKVKTMIDICERHKRENTDKIHEDRWFCERYYNEMKICPLDVACNFSIEIPSDTIYNLVKEQPMGMHSKYGSMEKFWGQDNAFEMKKYGKENILDIFICAHKEFTPVVNNPVYKTIYAKDINNDKADNGLDGSFYSEILTYFYIDDNYTLKDYVGFCAYRKYFEFMDNIPDIKTVIEKHGIILPKKINLARTVSQHYEMCHNIDDLKITLDIVKKLYPEYTDTFLTFLSMKEMYPYNMLILPSNDFHQYITFIRTILDEYLNIVGLDINKRIEDNKDKYITGKPWGKQEYQYRIGGFLAERLTNVYVLKHYPNPMTYRTVITENKPQTPKIKLTGTIHKFR